MLCDRSSPYPLRVIGSDNRQARAQSQQWAFQRYNPALCGRDHYSGTHRRSPNLCRDQADDQGSICSHVCRSVRLTENDRPGRFRQRLVRFQVDWDGLDSHALIVHLSLTRVKPVR